MSEAIIQDAEAQVTELNDECERLRARVKNLETAYANNLIVLGDTTRQLAEQAATIARLREALTDMLSGWRYIRVTHGDLPGVGWGRAQREAEAVLAEQPAKSGEWGDATCPECGRWMPTTIAGSYHCAYAADHPSNGPLTVARAALASRDEQTLRCICGAAGGYDDLCPHHGTAALAEQPS